jgi:phospholipase/carboxylesterase
MAFRSFDLEPKNGKPKSALILLHGVGSNGRDLISLAPMLADALPDTAFISPDAPFEYDMAIGYADMYQWFSLSDRAPEKILTGLRHVQPLVNNFIDSVLEKYALPASKLALFGFSQGTMTSLFVGARRADKIAGIVGCSGALLAPELLANEAVSKPDICLIHGEQDDVVPFAAMGKAEAELKGNGFSVEAHSRNGLAHSIDLQGIEFTKSFLKERLCRN